MAGKYYAVRIGKKPGIYRSWEECKAVVDGFSNARYKSFTTLEEAERFMGEDSASSSDTSAYAFVDGSFNGVTKLYGYGGFLCCEGKEYVLQGNGDDPALAEMRNVAGEICGSMAAIAKALELGLDEITILYDYLGIEMWATGAWKRNKEGTIAYYDYISSVKDRIKIHFKKVEAHTGVEGNERADRLAKQAVGLE